MLNKAIFLDRDGTINHDFGYVHDVKNFKFIEGSIEGLKKLYDLGFILIIITNQSGIGRGYYTVEDYKNLNDHMNLILKENGINIRKDYYCPHTDQDLCDCRKPKIKLFLDAAKELNIDLSKSYAIGDKERDLNICNYYPVKGILLSDYNDKFIFKKNLLDAALYIESEEEK